MRVYTHTEKEREHREQSRRDAEPAIRGNEASALEFSMESKHTHTSTHTRRELTEVALSYNISQPLVCTATHISYTLLVIIIQRMSSCSLINDTQLRKVRFSLPF